MRGAQTLVARGDQEVNVNDLRLLAINAAKLIQSRSNRRRVDQYFAVIALVRVGRRKGLKVSYAEFARLTPITGKAEI